jgi:ATP-dependent Clp protease adapter protein ClpS
MLLSYFDANKDTDLSSKVEINKKLQELLQLEDAETYSTILNNDPINTMEFAVRVIRNVFSYSISKSIQLMQKAHFTGKSTLWVGSLRAANDKRNKIISHGPDPTVRHKEAKPLMITIEKIAEHMQSECRFTP